MKANIIGAGFGSRVVAKVYEKAGIEVQVVSSRDAEAVKRACAEPVDLISIHSPPFLHREHVLLAVENKQNVLCDKPFGRSANEAREMLDAAESAGVLHFLNFEFRQESIRKKAKEWLDEGAIGTPTHVQWNSMMAGSRNPVKPYSWLWDRDLGGGWIGAFGSHAIDALRWWIGEIETASGICRTEIPFRPDNQGVDQLCTAEDSFTACFTFTNGVTALMDTGFSVPVSRPYAIEIFGTEGVISMNFGSQAELVRADKANQTFTTEPWAGDMHEPALIQWAGLLKDSVREGKQITPSFEDGLACAKVMDDLRANSVWIRQGESKKT